MFLVWMQCFKSQVSTSLSPHTDKGNHPVFIGPGILHKQKLCTSYKTLPLLMSKYHVGMNGVLVKGTDGEENMAKAFSDAYPDAKHLHLHCEGQRSSAN